MAEFQFEKYLLEDIIDKSILAWANKAKSISKEIVPRDPKRPPKNLKAKITGNLWKSLWMEKISSWEYVIWVIAGDTEDYAFTQEFGDSTRNIPSRSYLRILFDEKEDYHKEIMEVINKNLKKLLN